MSSVPSSSSTSWDNAYSFITVVLFNLFTWLNEIEHQVRRLNLPDGNRSEKEIAEDRGEGKLPVHYRNNMNSRVKIIHMALSMNYGGLERIINNLSKKMSRNYFKISICCLDGGGDLLDDLTDNSIKKFMFKRS